MTTQEKLDQIQQRAFEDIAMNKEPRLIVLATIRDTVGACLEHFSRTGLNGEQELNPNRKEVK